MEQGLKGAKLEYYAKAEKAHSSFDEAGSGIIGMLEVIESNFAKDISEIVAAG